MSYTTLIDGLKALNQGKQAIYQDLNTYWRELISLRGTPPTYVGYYRREIIQQQRKNICNHIIELHNRLIRNLEQIRDQVAYIEYGQTSPASQQIK